MARSQRRSARTNPRKSPEGSSLSARSSLEALETKAEISHPHANGETCPACSEGTTESLNAFDKENWVRCDVCKTWFHWRCAGNGEDVNCIDKWYCQSCIDVDPTRIITAKAPARKSSRKRTHRDYANLNSGIGSDPGRWVRMLDGKDIRGDPFKRLEGSSVGLSWLEKEDNAMTEPIVIEKPEGLGMQMPPEGFGIGDVAQIVGVDTPIEVIDVASQATSPGWTLGKWADYFELESDKRERILNVISLEVSGTKLANMILPPKIVRELDWVEQFWPSTRKGKGHVYPKVQLYCLMGVAGAWTDWHIDFAGSSVYYHILHGSKVFYFIRPTSANLAAYERWSGTDLQYQSWLGDLVDDVFKVELKAGNTMIIPTGWIHAVYTPVDTLVFGGNFLHSYNVPTQLRVRNIEIATQVPKKFRFPMFSKLCWYVGDKYMRDLKSQTVPLPSSRVLSSLVALADFLVSQVRILERGSDQAKKEVKEQIPTDRIKEPISMAREFRWRLRHAAGYLSDDEEPGPMYKAKELGDSSANGGKRRRIDAAGPSKVAEDTEGRFKNFKPKVWDGLVENKDVRSGEVIRALKPTTDNESWAKLWLEYSETAEGLGGEEAQVERQREVVVKVRQTAKGLERHRIERVVEDWVWG